MSNAVRSASSPVRYHWMSARSAAASPGLAWGMARFQVVHDALQLVVVAAADAVHLFDEPPVALHETRVERIALDEARRGRPSSRRCTGCWRCRAGCRRRRPASCSSPSDRPTGRGRAAPVVARSAPGDSPGSRAGTRRAARPPRPRAADASASTGELQHELPRREVVVAARVDPEELRVAPHLAAPRRPAAPRRAAPASRGSRASRGRARSAGRSRCRGRRAPPDTGARSAPSGRRGRPAKPSA